jgi:hypothetical protein
MKWRIIFAFALGSLAAWGAIIDRTAIVVGKHAVKDSDIQRDIRITSFLNGQPPDFSPSSRKVAAARLVDQELIREQIRSGRYSVADASEGARLLEEIKKDRFASDAQYQRELGQFGISEAELKDRLLWQLTVLRFIDARFRPAVVVSDQDVQQYYDAHRTELAKARPAAKGMDDLRPEIEPLIAGERINKLLEEWLDQSRKEIRIDYLEKSLQ